MAYATAAELRTYGGISSADDDALLTSLIARTTAMVENYVGFTFEASADTTQYLDADDVRNGGDVHGRDLIFPTWCYSITTVTNGDDTTVAAANYVKIPRTAPHYAIRLKRSAALVWEADDDADTEQVIEVAGRWGYSTTPPADIVHATLRLALWLYRQRDNSMDVDRPILAEGVMVLPGQWPSDVLHILDSYRWRGTR